MLGVLHQPTTDLLCNILIMKTFIFSFLILFLHQFVTAQYYNIHVDVLPNVTEGFLAGGDTDSGNNIFTAFIPPEIPETKFYVAKINPAGEVNTVIEMSGAFNQVYTSGLVHCMNDTVFIHGSTYENHVIQISDGNLDSLSRIFIPYPEEEYVERYALGTLTHDADFIYLTGKAHYVEEHPEEKVNAGVIMRLLRSDLSFYDYIIHPHAEMTDLIYSDPKFDTEGNLIIKYQAADRNNFWGYYHGRLKFDDDLNITEQIDLPFHNQRERVGESYELENGNFIFIDNGIDSLIFTRNLTSLLHCMTPEGEQVWRNEEYLYENHGTPAATAPIRFFSKGYTNADGNLVFANFYHDSSTPIEVRIICVSPNGEIVWERFYERPPGTMPNQGGIYYFYQDSDYNYVVVGYHRTLSGAGNHWLIRTDSNGCIEPGCELTDTEEVNYPENLFSIRQNPVRDNVTVTFDHAKINGTPIVQIYGTTGQLLRQQKAETNSGNIILPTGDLPGGVYFLSVSHYNGQILWQTKIVKM